jgi:hypothetical protein
MAEYDVDICDDWNGIQDGKVTFTNNTGSDCQITKDDGSIWPFKDGPPFPTDGPIRPGATASTHLKTKTHLPDGCYNYQVDCCADEGQKTVTVP